MHLRVQWLNTKSEVEPFAGEWIRLEIMILSELSQFQEDKCPVHFISFVAPRCHINT